MPVVLTKKLSQELSDMYNYPGSPLLEVAVVSVPGGFVWEISGAAQNAGPMGQRDGSPYPTAEAALAVAEGPETTDADAVVNCGEYMGDYE